MFIDPAAPYIQVFAHRLIYCTNLCIRAVMVWGSITNWSTYHSSQTRHRSTTVLIDGKQELDFANALQLAMLKSLGRRLGFPTRRLSRASLMNMLLLFESMYRSLAQILCLDTNADSFLFNSFIKG